MSIERRDVEEEKRGREEGNYKEGRAYREGEGKREGERERERKREREKPSRAGMGIRSKIQLRRGGGIGWVWRRIGN